MASTSTGPSDRRVSSGPSAADGGRPEVAFEPGVLAIGDLHLDVEIAPAVAQFLGWLERVDAPRLVILGDLFEYWVGDAQARTAGGQAVLAGLRRLVDSGCAVDLIPGNRDFLVGERFEAATGARIRPHGLVAQLPGSGRALLIHGDELCTLDRNYLRLRAVLRSPAVRWAAPRLPLALSRAIAGRLRKASQSALEYKPRAEAEQQADAAVALARAAGCDTLVCGHAHRWRDERLPGGPRWLVVDAFGEGRDLLEFGAGGAVQGLSSRDPRPPA